MPPEFSLQTVLDVRHSKVESFEIELSNLQHEKSQKENTIQSLYADQDHLYELLQRNMTGELNLVDIQLLRENIHHLSGQVENLNCEITELDQAINLKRAELINAKKEEESLKILKNKEYERYVSEENEKEKRLLDDVYISQGFRQRRNEIFS